ncbi:di-heme-cytochrome C peroxidase [Reyranella sp.]|uniref:di-heme-cytochrome C peroxidase n=1 Tax=Reyranella sp. TaxID=1929291 RepID=UPI003BA9033A
MGNSSPIYDASTLAVVCQGLGFSEGPIALPDGSVLLVDIRKQCLTRVLPDGSQVVVAKIPGGPNGAAFGPDGRLYICNNGGFEWQQFPLPGGQVISLGERQAKDYAGGSVQVLDLSTGRLETLYTDCAIGTEMGGLRARVPREVPSPSRLRGPDDLVFDSSGGFWFADFGKSRGRDKDITGIYYAHTDGSYIREKIFPLDGPNGIALSPAGDRLYVSLTFRRQLLYWELDRPGSIRPNPATVDGAYVLNAAMPGDLDSIKVDSEGNVHAVTILPSNTPLCNGGITVVSPSGEIVERFELAVPGKAMPMPSNLCWGGPDGRTAWITGGGSDVLLRVRTSVAGLPPAYPAVVPQATGGAGSEAVPQAGQPVMESRTDPPTARAGFKIWQIVLLQFVAMAKSGLSRRGQHPKQHGVVRATFEVRDDIPPAYKVGLFARPGRYDALIRFSNGPQVEDRAEGPQGMAIKLLGVTGEKILPNERDAQTHDFILIDSTVFFVRNIESYLRLFRELVLKFGGKPTEWLAWLGAKHPEDLSVVSNYHNHISDSPLTRVFWSQVPYAFGGGRTICRYSAVPGPGNGGPPIPTQGRDGNYLRRAMVEQLTVEARPATFEFRVQLLPDATPDDIDTPTVEWNTPEQIVADITIPAQVFDTRDQDAFGEGLSYTPWHALPEHKPVGEINLVRRSVYAATSRLRHIVRLARRREPMSVLPPPAPWRPVWRWATLVVIAGLLSWGTVAAVKLSTGLAIPLPTYPSVAKSVWMEQNWKPGDREWYHHANQGGQFPPMMNVPYEWFVALEQPRPSLGDAGAFSDPAYLDRFGLIPSSTEAGAYDWRHCREPDSTAGYQTGQQLLTWRHRLPVGLACSDPAAQPMLLPDGRPWRNPGTGGTMGMLGLTCAACHTGRLTYRGTELLIDGGSAMIDLKSLNEAIAVSLFLTDIDPWRFRRFALRLLGADANDESRAALRDQLAAAVVRAKALKALDDAVEPLGTREGFGRLDALSRIGNQVFAIDLERPGNYAATAAPVHFPRIWDTHWFPWAQYSASIGQPMVRNAGEALGTGGSVALAGTLVPGGSLTAPLYASTVQIGKLGDMETMLAGGQPTEERGFTGLHPPKWPEETLGPIDVELARRGAGLYVEICQHCHLPSKRNPAFWESEHWTAPNKAGQRYLKLVEVPVEEVGTDATYLETVASRRVKVPPELGLTDDRFLFALRDVVGRTTKAWYDSRKMDQDERDRMDGNRDNDVRLEAIYKARPLDGVWATPPYLHNGSVPTIADLLSPVKDRPARFWLGHREYDPAKLGYRHDELAGGFLLDTSRAGNRNTGHAFDDSYGKPGQGRGVVGRGLAPDERLALIEFLKSMGSDREPMP